MGRIATFAIAFCLVIAIAGCGGGGGGSTEAPASPGAAGKTISQSINSIAAGERYDLSIYLPPGYDQNTASYPVIYLTDAEWRFAPDLQVLQASGVNAILVAIGNMGETRRQMDFLMPGALNYYKFLTTELMPFVEGQLRVDPTRRILSGHSSGGLFTMYAFLLEAANGRHNYYAFMSEDSSFWQQPDQLDAMEQSLFAQHVAVPVTMFMSGDASGGNYASVAPFYCLLKSRAYAELDLEASEYFVGHLPSDPLAFGDALNTIFKLGKTAVGLPIKC